MRIINKSHIALAMLTLVGCEKAQVRIYDRPKQEIEPTMQTQLPPNENSESGIVVWEKPSAWEELPPTAFRKGNYRYDSEAGAVEITVTSFPGEVGGLLANVNRWLGQAQLPPIEARDLTRIASRRLVDGNPVTIVDLNADATTPGDTRIYAAISLFAGQSWFFKMSGPNSAVAEQIEPFDQMIDGLKFESSSAEAAAVSGSAEAAPEDEISFDPPEGWEPAPGSSLRIASYSIPKEGFEPADFSLTAFPGDTGGTLANVNRWRGQIGLDPWTQAQVERRTRTVLTESGLKFELFDLKPPSGDEPVSGKQRIMVAVLKHGGKSWFFKLRGEVFLLETQRSKFNGLLESVHFHAAGENHAH